MLERKKRKEKQNKKKERKPERATMAMVQTNQTAERKNKCTHERDKASVPSIVLFIIIQ